MEYWLLAGILGGVFMVINFAKWKSATYRKENITIADICTAIFYSIVTIFGAMVFGYFSLLVGILIFVETFFQESMERILNYKPFGENNEQ